VGLRLLGAIPGGLELNRGIHIERERGRPLVIHVARPKGGSRARPCFVYIFGGGWETNGPDQGIPAVLAMALKGYVAAAIDYRLSSEAQFPAQLEDCKTAVRFLRANASPFGLDPDRIGVLGLSSGGHLAALLGTTADRPEFEGPGWRDQRSDVQAVAVWSAPVDFLRIADDHGNAQSASTMTARLVGGALAENQEMVRRANPVTYVTGREPPFLIVHGKRDRLVPPHQGEILFEALANAGARAQLVMLPEKGHGFLGVKAVRVTAGFFDRELKRSQGYQVP
jgi:acetyl esterase/lipase